MWVLDLFAAIQEQAVTENMHLQASSNAEDEARAWNWIMAEWGIYLDIALNSHKCT